jgi:hypothetical protein
MNQSFNHTSARLHWNYFLALEKDLEAVSRYIEFSPDNFNTYSIELAHLLLSAASEVDTLAKCVCSILEPNNQPDNINEYRKVIKSAEETESEIVIRFAKSPAVKHTVLPEAKRHRLSSLSVFVPRHGLVFAPWGNWAKDKNPDWWRAYNDVKHKRNVHFNKATLHNAINALAGLLAMNYIYFRYEISKANLQNRCRNRKANVTRRMEPHSTLLRFGPDFYDDPVADLAKYVFSGE